MKLPLMAAALLCLGSCSSATCPTGRVGDTGACRAGPAPGTKQGSVVAHGSSADADAGTTEE
jgi:hypothetical protein